MTTEFQDGASKAKQDRGRWKVLGLIALYLVLSVAAGAARCD